MLSRNGVRRFNHQWPFSVIYCYGQPETELNDPKKTFIFFSQKKIKKRGKDIQQNVNQYKDVALQHGQNNDTRHIYSQQGHTLEWSILKLFHSGWLRLTFV